MVNYNQNMVFVIKAWLNIIKTWFLLQKYCFSFSNYGIIKPNDGKLLENRALQGKKSARGVRESLCD